LGAHHGSVAAKAISVAHNLPALLSRPQTLLRSTEPTKDSIVMDMPYQNSVVEEMLQHPEWLE
jgi:hypothetical protein